MMDEKQQVFLPPLRRYELPDSPATILDLPPEKDTFVVPGERMTEDERRSMAQPIIMPPLRPEEMPDSTVSVFDATPDLRLDDTDWGTAKKAPEITLRKGKMLHPWDD
jgi:hypothetical protein